MGDVLALLKMGDDERRRGSFHSVLKMRTIERERGLGGGKAEVPHCVTAAEAKEEGNLLVQEVICSR